MAVFALDLPKIAKKSNWLLFEQYPTPLTCFLDIHWKNNARKQVWQPLLPPPPKDLNTPRVFGHGQPFITVNTFQFLPLFSSFPLGWNYSFHFADVLQLPLTTFDERSYSCVFSPLFPTEVYCPPGTLLGQYFFGVRWLVYRLHLGQLTIVHGRQARSFQCRLEGWSGGRRPSNIDSTPTTSSASDETSVIIIITAIDVITITNMSAPQKMAVAKAVLQKWSISQTWIQMS